MAKRRLREYTAGDGTRWGVDVTLPGASNVMIVFLHPDGHSARKDRYAWFYVNSPEARNVTARQDPDVVLHGLSDEQIARLFRRSMLISASDSPLNLPIPTSA
jgi:hypothetical protein